MHVASVSSGCCKSRLRCCICYNGYTHMLQASIPNVSSVSSNVCCKCVYLDCICFTHILQVFYLNVARAFAMAFQVFLCVFANISDTYFKCFICFYTYITNVSSDSFKSGSDVAIGDPPTAAGVQAREVEGGVSNLCEVKRHRHRSDRCGQRSDRHRPPPGCAKQVRLDAGVRQGTCTAVDQRANYLVRYIWQYQITIRNYQIYSKSRYRKSGKNNRFWYGRP
jgi:hypothetical protein